ncbi:hypothetical protein BH708_06380 [Brachybacterium sp. P6-10-X1]|uniref:hypothetical protein n=1 Tax=Brachybacterium sp. P6-10-X1 TaxID=1903186 RepID=UPI000971B0F7|nr:hypothetical protein [Brachybacterium sp. P6-10-X1]APX32410.1 hypothetical protein BH708_06380 [Brachybacterium sp. P6-10-X1]
MSDAQRAENAPPAHEEPDEAQEAVAGTNDAENAGSEDEGLVAKLRKEAAGHRSRLREAETRAEAAESQRDALAAFALAEALRGTRLTPELFAADGHELASFIGEDGLDAERLRATARDTAKKYGLRGGVSPHTGTGGERPASRTWGDALKQG